MAQVQVASRRYFRELVKIRSIKDGVAVVAYFRPLLDANGKRIPRLDNPLLSEGRYIDLELKIVTNAFTPEAVKRAQNKKMMFAVINLIDASIEFDQDNNPF